VVFLPGISDPRSRQFRVPLSDLRKDVRPIYVKIGILPEVAKGLQQSTELSVPPET
jgi:hypothetical protein